MAKKYQEIENIEKIRKRISDLTEQISMEKPILSMIKDNPAATLVIMLIAGILTALVSRSIVKSLLGLASAGLKAAAFFYFIKKGTVFFKR